METDILMKHILNSDPPNHNQLQNLVHTAFTTRIIAKLRKIICHNSLNPVQFLHLS